MERSAFNRRLKHELAHAYIHAIAMATRLEKDDYVPSWLDEGVAFLLAGQTSHEPEPITVSKLRSLYKTFDSEKFPVGSKMVQMIIEQYGKNKLIELIKMPSHEQILDELQRMFPWLK